MFARWEQQVGQAAGCAFLKFHRCSCFARVQMGALAAPLIRRELPWVRVVLCLREPISHALSLLNHHMQVGWWAGRCG